MKESQFTRGAWLTLAMVLFLLVWGTGTVLYYFTLPTDGWFTKTPDTFGTYGDVYIENLMGLPSDLQTRDHLVGIDGIVFDESNALYALHDRWLTGSTLRYTVERQGATLDLPVTLTTWQIAPALNNFLQQSGGISTLLGELLFTAIAALAFFRHPDDHAACTLLLYAALFLLLTPIINITQSNAADATDPGLSLIGFVTTGAAYTLLFPPVLLHFALVFPRPKPIVRRYPFLEYVPYLIGLGTISFFLFGYFIGVYGWTIFSVIGALVILIHSAFTMRDSVSRAQLAWGVWGFILGTFMICLSFLVTFGVATGELATVLNGAANLSFSVMGITLGIAVLRYRLFDIGILIRRTLTYTLVTLLLLVVFFGSVILLQQIFSSFTSSGQNEIVTVLSTLAIAALFVPVRNRIQTEIDKRFNRKKYNAQQVLSDFANTVRDETDLEKLTGRLMQVVDETMQPRSVSLWLKKESKRNGDSR